MRSIPFVLVGASVVLAVPLVVAGSATAKPRPRVRPAQVSLVEAPYGLQGATGAGSNVAIPFRLRDRAFRPSDVDMQYGIDRDADGVIEDSEYRTATEARLDSRNTRRDRRPQVFRTVADMGAAHAIVWQSSTDVANVRLVSGPEYAMDPQGRFLRNELDPDQFEVASVNAGVKIRLRAVSSSGARGEWNVSGAFSLNNGHAPSMRFDSIATGSPVLVGWTAFDRDSEDENGNGVLDVDQGEDLDGDGILSDEHVGIAFDWHPLAPGENPATMTDAQLAALVWHACTRDKTVGDTDSLDARAGVPIPTSGELAGVPSAPFGVGRQWVFAWDAAHDAGDITGGVILRATPFDQERNHGSTTYSRTVIR